MAGQKSKHVETTACDLHAATLFFKTLVSWPSASRKVGSVDIPSVTLSATCKSKLHLLGSALIRPLRISAQLWDLAAPSVVGGPHWNAADRQVLRQIPRHSQPRNKTGALIIFLVSPSPSLSLSISLSLYLSLSLSLSIILTFSPSPIILFLLPLYGGGLPVVTVSSCLGLITSIAVTTL